MEKTNVMRLLDVNNILYRPFEYDPSITSGETVAMVLREDPDSVFKSLVCENERKEHFIFEVPVNKELNLKKAAKVSESKSIQMIKQKDLLPLTGYVHGGCSPIGLKKPMPVYIEETARLFDKITISAGKKGYQVELSPIDLANFLNATFASLTD